MVVSRETIRPVGMTVLVDLPAEAASRGRKVEVADSLTEAAREFYDPATRRFVEGWHVSMNRMALLGDWYHEPGAPAMPGRG